MATDNEQLVLSISADTRQIQRQLKSLVGQTQANTKAIEDAFNGIDKASGSAFDRVAANSNKAFTTAEQGAKRFQNAMRASTVQTGNLAAQLNDIGVQLAGGQSPFLIALQQGTQITQALGSGTGLRGAVAGVAAAFTSLLNPVSLATIAIIALGGEAVQYFTSLMSNSDKSAEALKEQADLIASVAKTWGDATPALQAYVDTLQTAKDAADLINATDALASQSWSVARAEVVDLNTAFAAMLQDLRAAGESDETILALSNAFNELRQKVSDGKATSDDMDAVTKALANTIYSDGIPSVEDFSKQFAGLGDSIAGATAQATRLQQEALKALTLGKNGPALGSLSPLFSENGKITTGEEFIPNGEVPTPGVNPLRNESLNNEDLYGKPKKATRDKAVESAKREKEAVVELIQQLEFEQSLIGMTSAERAEANALRRAGAAATDEQKAKISQLVEASYAERDAIRANRDAMEELQDVSRDVLGGIISDLREGKSGADILAGALERVASRLFDAGLNGLFPSTGAGGGAGKGIFGGAIIPGILHDGGVAGMDGYGHGRAVSPSVFKGAKRYHNGGIAGLRPNEVPAILERGERITPKGASGSGGSTVINYSPSYDNRGVDNERLTRLEMLQEKDRREFSSRAVSAVQKARKSNVKGV